MRRKMWLALLVAPWLSGSLSQAAEPVGLLSLVTGDVQIVRAGAASSIAARTADLIGPGDRVLTGANSEAIFLYCPESRAAKMTAQSEVQFDATALAVKKGKLADDRKIPTCRLPASLVLAAGSKQQAGNMRLRGEGMVLRVPSNTAVASLRPHFRWDAVQNAASYEIKVTDREEHVLWNASVTATDVQYPADATALAWGQKYRWHVTARSSDDSLDDAGSTFQVMPSDQAEKVNVAAADLEKLRAANPGDKAPVFLLAFLYEDNGMLDEAVRLYSDLAKSMGPQDWVQSRLNDLMAKLGWDKLDPGTPK